MCLVHLFLNFHPFLSNWIPLILSCLIVTSNFKGFNGKFTLIDLTCDSKKCFIHMTNGMASSTATSSASVELLVLNFYFDNKDKTLPLLRRPMLNYNRDKRSCVLNCYQLSLWSYLLVLYLYLSLSLLQFESFRLLLLVCAHL